MLATSPFSTATSDLSRRLRWLHGEAELPASVVLLRRLRRIVNAGDVDSQYVARCFEMRRHSLLFQNRVHVVVDKNDFDFEVSPDDYHGDGSGF